MQERSQENINTPEYWDKIGREEFEAGELREFHWRFDPIVQELRGDTILDVGCGTGALCRRINSSLDGSAQVYGVDFSPEQIKICNEISRSRSDLYPTEYYAVGDAYKLPYSDARFTSVVCSEVLEHLDSPRRAIREMLRVLKPGGRLVVTVPFNEVIVPGSEHVNTFTEETFSAILEGYGLYRFAYFRSYILCVLIYNGRNYEI